MQTTSGTMKLPTTSVDTHHVAGVWSRLFEEDPLASGKFDRETLVHWTQAPRGIYVDLRLPKQAPGLSLTAAAAAGYSPNPYALVADGTDDVVSSSCFQKNVDILLQQKSFAGSLLFAFGDTTSGEALTKDPLLKELSENPNAAIPLCTCFWRRDMDYQPPSGGLDVGVCASGPRASDDGTIDLRETGDDGSYAEGWRRLAGTAPATTGVYCALELVEENGVATTRKGYWVRAGNRFAYAIGRPSSDTIANQVGKSLAEVLSSSSDDALSQAMSYIAAIGQVRDDGSWYIESSTRPDLVGCSLVGGGGSGGNTCCSSLSRRTEDNYVNQSILGSLVRKWRVVEIEGFELPLED